jgi:hypothetical protein
MADNKKSDDKFIEQLAQLSLRRLINLNLNIFEFIFGYFLAAIGLILLLVFSFGIASLSSILLVGLVMGKSLPEYSMSGLICGSMRGIALGTY